MIIYAVYVISITGKPIVSEKFQSASSIPREALLAGLLTAIQGATTEITVNKSELNTIVVDNLSYHFKTFGRYQIVLVSDISKSPENVLKRIGLRFMKEYGEKLLEGDLNNQTFTPFIKTIREVVQEESYIDNLKMIDPTEKFSPKVLYELPNSLRTVAVTMITLKEGNLDQIAEESGKDVDETKNLLFSLQELGLIGKRITNGNAIYFCSF
ncbi:MAG: hypothetical protein ACFFFG_11270 [Candidatus Thorarchaeota archaeon]